MAGIGGSLFNNQDPKCTFYWSGAVERTFYGN